MKNDPLTERDLRTRLNVPPTFDVGHHLRELARVVLPALLGALVVAGVAYEAVSAQPPQYQNSVTAKIDSGALAGMTDVTVNTLAPKSCNTTAPRKATTAPTRKHSRATMGVALRPVCSMWATVEVWGNEALQFVMFAILAKLLDIEVFAYGVGGYGTLQEFLILDRYFDVIHPDVILWQYCINDFINNDNQLERLSRINNNGWVRPYWLQGHIQLLSPKESSIQVRDWINRHSRFLYFVVTRLDRLRASQTRDTVEVDIEAEGMRHAGFARAVGVTDELMAQVRARVAQRPIMAFNCVEKEPYSQALRDISAHHGITYWDDVARTVQAAAERGEDVYASDGGHWNEHGHELAAKALAKHISTELALSPAQK